MTSRGEDRLQAGFEMGATVVDPRPALGLWRTDREGAENALAAEAPTRQSPDVVEALAAHEFSLAHTRREQAPPMPSFDLAPLPELVKWEIALEPAALAPVGEGFEDSHPTRIRTSRGGVPLAPWSMATVVIPRDRLPPWPLRPEPAPAVVRSPSKMIWQVLLASGVLVSAALLALLIRGSG